VRKLIAVPILVALAVGGCGGKDAAGGGGGGTTTTSAPSGAPTTDCTATDTEELYVTKMYDCNTRGTRVYLFNTSTAKDSYWKAAAEFGSVKVAEGDTWLEVKAE
jgi:hypothetical protein